MSSNRVHTPIYDFVQVYCNRNVSRLHMPGHKGHSFLGCEALDITEIEGADSLYAPEGIIAESEGYATNLFGTKHTFYSTEGASHCIRSMLYLAAQDADAGVRPRILAARNVHQSFIYAAALLDLDVTWLWPADAASLYGDSITPKLLKDVLSCMDQLPQAVYVTSPNYLGQCLDIAGLSNVCRSFHLPLFVDGAHGAYLHFLPEPCHPMDLGATVCCDSAHKTLPVLTGGAYLHIAENAPAHYAANARNAMAMFGSTSPSYLTLQSLDCANAYLSEGYTGALMDCIAQVEALRQCLRQKHWTILDTDPLKLTIHASKSGMTGLALSDYLRQCNIECEHADPDFIIMMFTPQNTAIDYKRIVAAFDACENVALAGQVMPPPALSKPQCRMHIRQALFSPYESIPVQQAQGRICSVPVVSCPPGIPIVSSGEVFHAAQIHLCLHYGFSQVQVVRA